MVRATAPCGLWPSTLSFAKVVHSLSGTIYSEWWV